jgi:putative peptidoglycan lipid II flippase
MRAVAENFVGEAASDAVPSDTRPVADDLAGANTGTPVRLVAGASVADGRYRLLVHHGGPAGLQFWQALDTALNRQVAVTIVGLDDGNPGAGGGGRYGAPVERGTVD